MIYAIECKRSNYHRFLPIKIGTAKCPVKRLAGLQTGCPDELSIMYRCIPASGIRDYVAERYIHQLLKPYRTSGEWFLLRESFITTEEQDDSLVSLLRLFGKVTTDFGHRHPRHSLPKRQTIVKSHFSEVLKYHKQSKRYHWWYKHILSS